MLTSQELPIVQDIAETVYIKLKNRLSYIGEDIVNNVPEYIAHRLINAIEWGSPQPEYTRYIAHHLVTGSFVYPYGTTVILKKYFDLPY